ncbi:MAG: hypothetical protein ACI88C_001110, partial [Acidimicrobiales bacterium]
YSSLVATLSGRLDQQPRSFELDSSFGDTHL